MATDLRLGQCYRDKAQPLFRRGRLVGLMRDGKLILESGPSGARELLVVPPDDWEQVVRCPECDGRGWHPVEHARATGPTHTRCERCDGTGWVREEG